MVRMISQPMAESENSKILQIFHRFSFVKSLSTRTYKPIFSMGHTRNIVPRNIVFIWKKTKPFQTDKEKKKKKKQFLINLMNGDPLKIGRRAKEKVFFQTENYAIQLLF